MAGTRPSTTPGYAATEGRDRHAQSSSLSSRRFAGLTAFCAYATYGLQQRRTFVAGGCKSWIRERRGQQRGTRRWWKQRRDQQCGTRRWDQQCRDQQCWDQQCRDQQCWPRRWRNQRALPRLRLRTPTGIAKLRMRRWQHCRTNWPLLEARQRLVRLGGRVVPFRQRRLGWAGFRRSQRPIMRWKAVRSRSSVLRARRLWTLRQ